MQLYVILRSTSHPLQLSSFVLMQHDAAGIGDILQHFLHYAWMHWAKWYVRGLRVGGAWSRKVEMQICITIRSDSGACVDCGWHLLKFQSSCY